MELDPREVEKEFDRQVSNLIQKGYPKYLGISEQEFLEKLESLREKVKTLSAPEIDLEKGVLPFVIVVKNDLITSEKAMSLAEKNGRQGVTILRPLISQDFKTLADLVIPNTQVYLLIDIDRGKTNINLPPNEALKIIKKMKRSPLTIDEGIAIITQYPEFLMKNNCFSLLGSRTGRDQRVPAIWINGKKEPNLGWCWDGNPHTWLGSASLKSRIGA